MLGTDAQIEDSGTTIAVGLDDGRDVAASEETAMRVRSRVASYWRGRVYGLFDGGRAARAAACDPEMPDSATVSESSQRRTPLQRGD